MQTQTIWEKGMILAIYLAGVFFVHKKEQAGKRRISPVCSFLLILCIVLGNFRAESAQKTEQENEAWFLQYADFKGKIEGSVYGKVEGMEVRRKKGQIVILLQECSITYKNMKEQPIMMKGRITIDLEDVFAGQKVLEQRILKRTGEEIQGKEIQEILQIGDFVEIQGSFFLPQTARNPGEWDYRMYCYARNIGFSGWGETIQCMKKGKAIWGKIKYQMMEVAAQILDFHMEERDAGMVKAMLLGQKADLDEQEKSLYQWSGIAHLIAVSGLHVSLFGMGCWNVIRRLRGSIAVSAFLSGSVVVLFGALTGWSPSAQRAVMMFCFTMGAKILGRTYDIWTAMAFSLLWILWENPRMMLDGGVQLSFGAVASIAGIGRILSNWGMGRRNGEGTSRICEMILMSLAVQWGTLPIICYWYFEFPPYSIVLNIIVIPLMGIVLVSGLFVILLGWISGLGWAAVMTAGPAHYILEWYHFLCVLSLHVPRSIQVTGRPSWGRIGLYYGILSVILGWCYMAYVKEEKQEGNQYQRGEKYQRIGKKEDCCQKKKQKKGCSQEEKQEKDCSQNGKCQENCKKTQWVRTGILIVLFFLCTGVLRAEKPEGMEIWFLDVGQGDGILIRTKEHNILIDGGSTDKKELGKYTLEPVLQSMGIEKLDYVFVSHGDNDHISGLEYLLGKESRIQVGGLVLPKGQKDPVYEQLASMAEGRILEFGEGDVWRANSLTLTGLNPPEEISIPDKNNHSMVILAEYEGSAILLTGDIEKKTEERLIQTYKTYLEQKEIAVLKIAHHGSETSTGEDFLDMADPECAIVSYGVGNRYGHPSQKVLERLKEKKIRILCTPDKGAVRLRFRRGKIQCE